MDWFISDHLGSTKLLIDQNGTHKFTGDDDPFGINLRSFGGRAVRIGMGEGPGREGLKGDGGPFGLESVAKLATLD